MEPLEISAKTVEEAIQIALMQLNASRDEVKVDVVSEGKPGLLGLGAEEAKITVERLTPMPEPEENEAELEEDVAGIAESVLERLLELMELEATIQRQTFQTTNGEEQVTSPLAFNVMGDDLGILIGRRGRRNPVATMALLGEEEGSSRHWQWIGILGVTAGILILSYYSVVAGWTLAYTVKSVTGAFTGASAEAVAAQFDNFVGDWRLVALCHTLFMGLTTFVVARGVERGLEQAVRFMVPALLALMIVLLGYWASSGHFGEGLAFMFTPDFDKLTWNSVLAAMGQAFFSLSIGMGAIMAMSQDQKANRQTLFW